jgi:60 kDa SS-A/Ro ribonucleoprotein
MNYLTRAGGHRQTPQSRPMRKDQVENSAGGFVWEVDPFTRLERFLILGSEGGSYYATEQDLTQQNVDCLDECLDEDDVRAVKLIVGVSGSGRAAKNDPALYALARAAAHANERTRKLALRRLPEVARYSTDLFKWLNYVKLHRGIGSQGMKRAIGRWYGSRTDPDEMARDEILARVAYQVVKYGSREGWTHRDVLRMPRPFPTFSTTERVEDPVLSGLYAWIVGKPVDDSIRAELPRVIYGYEAVQKATSVDRICQLIKEYKLTHEMIPSEAKAHAKVWQALMGSMPMTALIRNLAAMTRNGALKPLTPRADAVADKIMDRENLESARVHPITLLSALRTYASGRPVRGHGGEWIPIPVIVDALEDAFYTSFQFVEPTGQRMLLALDCSASMDGGDGYGFSSFRNCTGMEELSPREGAACMALVQARSGDPYQVLGFTTGGLTRIPITAKTRLDEAIQLMRQVRPGGTDASIPMLAANQEGWEVDCFCMYTDSESWAGRIHPQQALETYRRKHVKDARMVTVSMVANRYSINDPNDPKTMDIVGFDTAAPRLIAEFAGGKI